MSLKTITGHLLEARRRPSDAPALYFKRHRQWLSQSWSEYYDRVEAGGLGLASLGVGAGDKVAILSQSRFEWAVFDFATLGLGAVTVPIYQSAKPEELDWIIKHAEPKILVVEDRAQLSKWETLGKRSRSVMNVICIDPGQDPLPAGVLSMDDVLLLGREKWAGDRAHFERSCETVKRSDMATIVYTSGTTGDPKGVVLTHEQIMSEVTDLVKAFPISNQDSTLSFLPFAHVIGRVEIWLHMYLGFTIYFAEGIDHLRANLKESRPTVILGVPRIFEKIYVSLLAQIEGRPWRRALFKVLSSPTSPVPRFASDALLFKKLRDELGGRLRFVVSGGAPLEPEIAVFFRKAGLLLLEGYGLTETTAAITANTPGDYEFGTVGSPLPDVDIQLAADGEIMVKSGKVMVGYYKDEEATRAAFRDGYFLTGDVGVRTSGGHIKITDRKKDLIKTAGGKYVAPQKLEGLLKLNPAISNVLIHGDRRKYIVALVTLNEGYAKNLAREKGWTYKDFKTLSQRPEIKDAIRRQIASVNSQLASFETIKNFAILPEDFSIERGELTPSLKVRRKVCDEKYRGVIDGLY